MAYFVQSKSLFFISLHNIVNLSSSYTLRYILTNHSSLLHLRFPFVRSLQHVTYRSKQFNHWLPFLFLHPHFLSSSKLKSTLPDINVSAFSFDSFSYLFIVNGHLPVLQQFSGCKRPHILFAFYFKKLTVETPQFFRGSKTLQATHHVTINTKKMGLQLIFFQAGPTVYS